MIWQHLAVDKNKVVKEPKPPLRHLPRLPYVRGDVLLDAISRVEHEGGAYEYVVDEDKCIDCGVCAGICTAACRRRE